MSDASRERTVEILGNHQEQLAAFARKSFDLDGRGVIQVGFPNVPPGLTMVGVTMMKYVTLQEFRRITSARDPEASILRRMIETYDPSKQAVVMAAIDGENPISVKMRLESPLMLDDPGGVH